MGEIELEMPARPEYLSLARQVAAAAAAVEPRFRTDRIDDLRLAVSEATTNAVRAHAAISRNERIVIRCRLDPDGDRIEVEVRDCGTGFDERSVPVVPPPENPERLEWEHGLGLPLMRELADEAEIRSSADGTSVRLVVYRSAALARRSADPAPPSQSV